MDYIICWYGAACCPGADAVAGMLKCDLFFLLLGSVLQTAQ